MTTTDLPLDDPCHHSNLALRASHEGQVFTNTPIYAVLSQPYSSTDSESPDSFGNFPSAGNLTEALSNTFIKTSHIKFLEQGGARVVPLSYRLDKNQLNSLLNQVNGVYIPGDSPKILENDRYLSGVR